MAESEPKPTESADPETGSTVINRLRSRGARLMQWTAASRLRLVLVGSLTIVGLGVMFATWSYLARLAVSRQKPVAMATALAALDEGNYEEAKNLVGRLETRPDMPSHFGGALFVLGAAKAQEADSEWSGDRKRAVHLLASRYLRKARSLGVPPDRESESRFLLGRSLVRAHQPSQGILELEELLDGENPKPIETHTLLTEAYLALSNPNYEAALKHNEALIQQELLDAASRTQALIARTEILSRLGRLDDAKRQLEEIAQDTSQKVQVKSLSARLAIQVAQKLPEASPKRTSLLEGAIDDLREVQRLDRRSGQLTRQSMYWIAKTHELMGDRKTAIEQYENLGQIFGDTDEGLIAILTRAELAQEAGNAEQALAGYRTVLETVGQPVTYANGLMSLAELRKHLLSAHLLFVETDQSAHAISLLDQLFPVFELAEVTRLRALTLKNWGRSELDQANDSQGADAAELVRQGRYHQRAAGRAYEALAELRFATRHYTSDLWEAAELYFEGHSFSHAARVFEVFLQHEATRHRATALLRLGQCYLASGDATKAAITFEECIEVYPRDSVVYQARLDCSDAYLQIGNIKEAEELLLTNITGETMTPSSLQWRDSLFALGDLLHNSERFAEATRTLDEAVTRYPDAPQALLARYTIARSYHRAADKPAQRARDSKTESERQKNRKLRDKNLEAALGNYLKVQRIITLENRGASSELEKTLLRNCYMMQGSVLFQLRRFRDAHKAYANVSTLYQNEPFVLESFVHIANCWRRLDQPLNARQAIEQAKHVLTRLPTDTDFTIATNFSRQQWKLLLDEMSKW